MTVPEVLFVCGHNAGRSQLAAAPLAHHAAGRVRVRSAGAATAASLAVHRQVGFRTVGRRERLGRRHGVWRDVPLLERRSPVIT